MSTIYEWVVEEMEGEEIVSTSSFDTLPEAQAFADGEAKYVVCLRRDVGNDIDGLTNRQYAYPGDAKFEYGTRIPINFKRQLDSLIKPE